VEQQPTGDTLEDGAEIAVLGSGPAGSFFAYFLLTLAETVGKELQVDLYEARDFNKLAPGGCNMCGGIISETLVQNLATEGIHLPPTVVQRGIDSYVLHTEEENVRIEPTVPEKRIGAVYRGSGPRDTKERKWGSFDGHLQSIAVEKGARVVQGRVTGIERDNGRPRITARGVEPKTYDLLAVAAGINAGTLKALEAVGFGYRAPKTTKTFIREFYLGEDGVLEALGRSMHVFLLNIPKLEFAAVIPKGDYASVCLLGEDIDEDLVRRFFEVPQVRGCFPEDWEPGERSCHCAPRISLSPAAHPYADRIVFVGDCAVTRLYKDGIGAAYRTAKAAARTAVIEGVTKEAFQKHYGPICRSIRNDNRVGVVTFLVTRVIQKLRIARRAVMRMTFKEQAHAWIRPRMSGVLWDMFTGSASYLDVFLRTLHPVFLGRLVGNLTLCLWPRRWARRRKPSG
jgi:flavin-dependent dehydrogenase